MKVEIKSGEPGGKAHTYTSANGKIRHIIINTPSREYVHQSTSVDTFLGKTTFTFFTEIDDDQDKAFIVILSCESKVEQEELKRKRFEMFDRGQWSILGIDNELLSKDKL